ncbi:MAG: sel1 repeat family protein [Thermoguttaceae bacterium]|nr:sel1 repeat family protein [Thermoguttaceae bacterium]MBR4102976.1 sel1 repeat family protein [Thermoguttaceae bacterium]
MRFYGLPENKSVSNGFRVVIGRKIKESDKVLPIAVPAVVFPDATPAAPVAAAPAPVPAAPVAGAPVAPLAETCEPVAPVPDGVPVAVPAPAPGAFQWLERAAKAGNVDGLRAIFLFYDGENPEIAGAALEKYATRPDCKDAFVKLAPAVAYAYGFGVEQDAKKAFALYKKAAAADRRRHARRFSALEAARTGRRSGDSLSGRRSGAALGVSQGAERRARRRANRGGRERF